MSAEELKKGLKSPENSNWSEIFRLQRDLSGVALIWSQSVLTHTCILKEINGQTMTDVVFFIKIMPILKIGFYYKLGYFQIFSCMAL